MYAMNFNEAINTLAVFWEMFDTIERVEEYFCGKRCSSSSVNNDIKKEDQCEILAIDQLEIYSNDLQSPETRDSNSSLSFMSIDTSILDESHTSDRLTEEKIISEASIEIQRNDMIFDTNILLHEMTFPVNSDNAPHESLLLSEQKSTISSINSYTKEYQSDNITAINSLINATPHTKLTCQIPMKNESAFQKNGGQVASCGSGTLETELLTTSRVPPHENSEAAISDDNDTSHTFMKIVTLDDSSKTLIENATEEKSYNENSERGISKQALREDAEVFSLEKISKNTSTCQKIKKNGIVEDVSDNNNQNTVETLEDESYNDNKSHQENVQESINAAALKVTSSSWNLEAIMKFLYTITEPEAKKEILPERSFQMEVEVETRGAFCNYPTGKYMLELQHQSLWITKETDILFTMPLIDAEVTLDSLHLIVDNKIGRCLYMKCQTQGELLLLKEELEKYSHKHSDSDYIKLVHYPLKSHRNVIVVDLGSCSTRAGILMDQPTLPFIFFPSVCATDKTTGQHVYGKEALHDRVRQNSSISFPLRPSIKIIKHNIEVDLLEGLFRKIFLELRVDQTHFTVQVCLPRTLSNHTKSELVKLLLEDLEVRSVSLTHQTILTLYAHKVSTGIVVDIGDRMDILPVVDGFIVENGVTRLPNGGQRLIHHMKHALAEKHISLSSEIDSFVVQYISEKLTYIAKDFYSESQIALQYPDSLKKSVTLETISKSENRIQIATLDEARFKIPEGLFKPEFWGLDNPGIHQLVQKAIQTTSVDVRKKIAENIYVSGGVTLTPGFVERLTAEITCLNAPRITPKIIASDHRFHSTYIGACEFARMEVFPNVCLNIEEYSKNPLTSLKKFVLCY